MRAGTALDRPSIGRSGTVLDAVMGVVVAAFLITATPFTQVAQADPVPLNGVGYALLALTGLPLAVRRRWPHVMFLLGAGAAIAYLALRFPGWPVYWGAGIVLAAFIVSVGKAGWPFALVGGAALAAAAGRAVGWNPLQMLAVFAVWSAIAFLAALTADVRRRRAEEDARHRVVEERLRIAREMHDVLSHSLATISLRSGTGLRLLETQPEEAEAALRSIRQVSTDALVRARAALSTIRDPAVAERGSPLPDLDDLDALITSVRAGGVQVDASVEGGGPLPAAVGSAAYRVVQESLTNVMRHAGAGARANVDVARRSGGIVVEVTDAGASVVAPSVTTPGHGLMGMRERVLELGGEFEAGPRPAGGFRVWARLPIEDERR